VWDSSTLRGVRAKDMIITSKAFEKNAKGWIKVRTISHSSRIMCGRAAVWRGN
jgi:hypothetical protein